MRWMWHVCMGERRGAYRVLVGKLEGRDHLEEPGVDGRIILIWIFMKLDVGAWTEDKDRWQALVNAVMNLWVPFVD